MAVPEHDDLMSDLICHNCRSSRLELETGFERLHRVTSDCKPWPPGGMLATCADCGLVQYVTTEQWSKDADAIYRGYTIYHQSGGVEQSVFEGGSGKGSLRSDVIIRALIDHHALPDAGSLLDVGCGNGGFLKACHPALPEWDLQGSEVDDKYKAHVEALPGVTRMHAAPLDEIPGTFDVISLVHVLEHIPDPAGFLGQLTDRLKPDGVVFVEVPNCRANPFSLLIADHASHFSPQSLAGVARRAGMDPTMVSDAWVQREISMVARLVKDDAVSSGEVRDGAAIVGGHDWLKEVHQQVRNLSELGEFGIFGTSIAATALEAQTGNRAAFFVDEDPNRRGKQHLDKPILAPDQLPRGASVFVALPPVQAEQVVTRLRGLNLDLNLEAPGKLP